MKFFDKKTQIFIVISFITICVAIYFFTQNKSENIVSSSDFYVSNTSLDTSLEISEIIVHIDGEVLNPGIVSLEKDARISDAIKAAGGLTDIADTSKVNLAYILKDGQKIYIPSVYDENSITYIFDNAGDNVLIPDANISSSLININSATISELSTLSGIGSSTASKIIQYREENGKFKNIEEIMNVPGIGESKFNTIKSFICI